MKKVILIGDSIRMSYQSIVRENLLGKADVVWPEENCRFAKYTLWCVNSWIKQLGDPDVIHWNNGIWDIFHLNEDIGIYTKLEDYITDLGRVVRELKKTRAQIIWATTTAVDDRCVCCRNGEIDAYNKAAVDLMRREGIPVNDLNGITRGNTALYISEDYFHLSQEGQQACGDAVSSCIKGLID